MALQTIDCSNQIICGYPSAIYNCFGIGIVPFVVACPGFAVSGGDFITHLGGSFDRSVSSPGSVQIGFVANVGVADRFVLPTFSTIQVLTFYTFQLSLSTPSINGLFVQIWNGSPNVTGSSVVWGSSSTSILSSTSNLLSSTGGVVYRRSTTSSTDTTRRIQASVASGLNIRLPAGSYWLQWQITASTSAIPTVPQVSSTIAQVSGVALGLASPSTWFRLMDGTVQAALPFLIQGVECK
jgi:hypothetical protein